MHIPTLASHLEIFHLPYRANSYPSDPKIDESLYVSDFLQKLVIGVVDHAENDGDVKNSCRCHLLLLRAKHMTVK